MNREQTTIRLPADLYRQLVKISEQTGLTVTALLIVAIWRRILKSKRLPQ